MYGIILDIKTGLNTKYYFFKYMELIIELGF